MPPRNGQIKYLELFLILALAIQFSQLLERTGTNTGIDFYQYWSVGHVIRLTDGEVRNPYKQYEAFNATLAKDAQASIDPLYKRVQSIRKDLEFQGSPMAYTFFSILPSLPYTLTLRFYFVLQCILFLYVVYRLTRLATGTYFQSTLAAVVMALAYKPFQVDLSVGNMNTIVMFVLLLVLLIGNKLIECDEPRTQPRHRNSIVFGSLLLILSGFVSMLKPTVALAGFAMFLFLAARFGVKKTWPSIFISALILACIAYLPGLRLGSQTIWYDWREYFEHGNLDMFDLPVTKGNYSTTLFLSKTLGLSVRTISFLVVASLALSFFWIAHRSGKFSRTIKSSFADPLFSLAFGLTVFFAISPLVWSHYYLLVLIPGITLMHPRYHSTHVSKFMIASLFFASSIALQVAWIAREFLPHEAIDNQVSISIWIMISWIPLWLGLLNVVGGYGNNKIIAIERGLPPIAPNIQSA